MKTIQYIFLFGLVLILSSSTCNKKSTDESAKEIRKEINLSESASSDESTSSAAASVRDEINEMSEESSSKEISKKCSEDLKEYQDNVDKLLALSKKRAQGDDSEETKAEMKEINAKLQSLGKEMEKHPTMFTDPDCTNAWMKMSQEYATYMMNNISDFMPTQK